MNQTRLFLLLALAGMALGGVLAVHAVQQSDTAPSIYMASALYARLARNPRAWNGRTVLVWGVIVGCRPSEQCGRLPWGQPETRLGTLGATTAVGTIPVLWGIANSWTEVLRHLPLVSHLIPGPRPASVTRPAVYRLHFQPGPAHYCSHSPCIVGRLVDTPG
jgi:hypothetical protein